MEKEESIEKDNKEDQTEIEESKSEKTEDINCLLYTSPSPRD